MSTDQIQPDEAYITSLSLRFLDLAAKISTDAGPVLAETTYTLMYSSYGGNICLCERDQILPAVSLRLGQNTILSAGTGSEKTLQILSAALLNPGKTILVLSPSCVSSLFFSPLSCNINAGR